MQYPHIMLCFKNKIPYIMLKASKPHAVWEGVVFQCPTFGKFRDDNCTLSKDLLALFFVIAHACTSLVYPRDIEILG